MRNSIDYTSHIPLHLQIEEYLRELIKHKEYMDGKALPGEVEISRKFGVSRNTFRTAMDRLVRDGLVVRKPGVGSFVNKEPISTTLSKWDSFSDEMNAKGIVFTNISQKVSWGKVSGETACAMGIGTEERVCCLERLRGIGEQPVVLFLSYFPPRVGIREDETFEGKLYSILENKYQQVPAISNEEIRAIKCDAHFAKKLSQPMDVPILCRKRKVLNAAGKLLELCYAYYRSDKFVYSIQIRREGKER